MRVGFDATPAIQQRAGIGRYARELLRELVQIDPRDRYLMAASATRDEVEEFLRYLPPGAWREVHRLPLSERLMTIGWQRLRIPAKLERFTGEVDVVHGLDFVLPPSEAPGVVTIHDLTYVTHPQFAEPSLVKYLTTAVPRAIERSEAVITVSAAVAGQVAEYYPAARGKLVAIPNGVRPPKQINQGEVRSIDSQPTILIVGTIEPRKNHLALLEAMPLVRAGFPDARLIIAGRPGWRAEVLLSAIQRAAADGTAEWESDASDERLETLFRSATIAVYPSMAEGFGLPALEAMIRGLPTILSDIPAHREVAGDAALYVSPDDPEDLAASICRLLEDDSSRIELASRGRDRARNFSWSETARRTRRIYQQIADQ